MEPSLSLVGAATLGMLAEVTEVMQRARGRMRSFMWARVIIVMEVSG